MTIFILSILLAIVTLYALVTTVHLGKSVLKEDNLGREVMRLIRECEERDECINGQGAALRNAYQRLENLEWAMGDIGSEHGSEL